MDFAARKAERHRSASLLDLHPHRPDDGSPLFGFISDELCEIGGRTRHHSSTLFCETSLNVGIPDAGVYLAVELINDPGWRSAWRADAEPSNCLVAGNELT